MLEWLVSIRKNQGYSRKEVAAHCLMSESYYQKIEYGQRNASVGAAKKIADFFGFAWQKFFEETYAETENG